MRLTVTDPDGQQLVLPSTSELTLPPRNEDQSAAYNILIHLREMHIREAGEHTVDFYLNGNLEGRLPFTVLPATEPADEEPVW